jgi:hypothetical protein
MKTSYTDTAATITTTLSGRRTAGRRARSCVQIEAPLHSCADAANLSL